MDTLTTPTVQSKAGRSASLTAVTNRDQLTGESRTSNWGSKSFDSGANQTDTTDGDVQVQWNLPIMDSLDKRYLCISLNDSRFTDSVHYREPLEFVESLVVRPDMTFKVLIVGNPHVGKSCYLMRLCTGTFTTRYASTIGVDFYSRSIKFNDQIVSLQLWDTAGQERFQSVTRAYYRGANGVILMYDISSEESFIAVKTWINSIKENMQGLPTSLLLVGNKTDLDEYSRREVPYDVGENFARLYNAEFIETSAKNGFNVGHSCLTLINLLVKDSKGQGTVGFDGNALQSEDKKKKSFCCNKT